MITKTDLTISIFLASIAGWLGGMIHSAIAFGGL